MNCLLVCIFTYLPAFLSDYQSNYMSACFPTDLPACCLSVMMFIIWISQLFGHTRVKMRVYCKSTHFLDCHGLSNWL